MANTQVGRMKFTLGKNADEKGRLRDEIDRLKIQLAKSVPRADLECAYQ